MNRCLPENFLTLTSYSDIGKYKAEALRDKLLNKDSRRNISAIVEHVVYGDLDASTRLIENLDLVIATMENSRVSIDPGNELWKRIVLFLSQFKRIFDF